MGDLGVKYNFGDRRKFLTSGLIDCIFHENTHFNMASNKEE
jgi:hypothetical protein